MTIETTEIYRVGKDLGERRRKSAFDRHKKIKRFSISTYQVEIENL